MPWTRDDWIEWLEQTPGRHGDDEYEQVVSAILRSMPDSEHRTLAFVAGAQIPERRRVARRFARVMELNRPGALIAQRGYRSVDVAIADVRESTSEAFDALLVRTFHALSEGGMLIAVLRGTTETRPIPMIPDDDDEPSDAGHRWHELAVQYRLRRRGYLGVRARRFGNPHGDPIIVALGVRRALN